MALGGVLAATAVVLMCLGTMIPVATYVCPFLCVLVLQVYFKIVGPRMAWVWYACVALLCLLLAPDKEAALVFTAVGYYPILKPWLEKRKFPWLWKALVFNAAILLTYGLLIRLFGLGQVVAEFQEMGRILSALMLVLGNVIFFMVDKILSRKFNRGGK